MKTKLWYLIVLLLIAGPAQSRTWYITPDGNGDAPTIEAAMDSAGAGDTVLVADGEYQTDGITVRAFVTLKSESGPENCMISPFNGATVALVGLMSGAKVIGFTIGWANLWSVYIQVGQSDCEIAYNVIPEPGWQAGIELSGELANVHHNTIVGDANRDVILNMGAAFVVHNILIGRVPDCGAVGFACNIVSPGSACINVGNFGVDPLFCGPDNYYLRSDSPALPENSPSFCTEVIGALPQGCVVVPTESKSWGAVKALYHGE